MDVFTLFANTPYTFLEIVQGAGGNHIGATFEASGVFKLREGMMNIQDIEQYGGGDATLHIKPDEPYVLVLDHELMGHGISIGKHGMGETVYRIIGVTEGYDYDKGELQFYRLILKREDIATWQSEETVLE